MYQDMFWCERTSTSSGNSLRRKCSMIETAAVLCPCDVTRKQSDWPRPAAQKQALWDVQTLYKIRSVQIVLNCAL